MDAKKNKQEKAVVAEFKVSMHCNACEISVAKAISKIKGVEQFMTDMTNHRVVITGRINPQKVLKKLKKKTGKKIELLAYEDDVKDDDREENLVSENSSNQALNSWLNSYYGDRDSEIHLMFNDENANSCSIM